MQSRRSTTRSSAGHASPSGFTFTELMVVLTIVAIMAAMSVPSFQRAMEQSRADVAAANLRAIWAAQRLFWLENHAFAADLPTLRTLRLLDPLLDPIIPTGNYTYNIASPDNDTFTAVAIHEGGTSWAGTLTIDQTGTTSGAISATGQTSITPGFQ